MADIGPVPDVDPVAAGALRDADLDAIVAELAGPNPHPADMDQVITLITPEGIDAQAQSGGTSLGAEILVNGHNRHPGCLECNGDDEAG